jgi:hypothetical protein
MGWNKRFRRPSKRRGRPPATEREPTWGPYQNMVILVHRLQMANPSAKLDIEIVPRVARYFGVAERKVWRALKFHERMTAGRDPVEAKHVIKDGDVALEFSLPVAAEFVEEAKAWANQPIELMAKHGGVGATYARRMALMQLLNIKFEDFDT